MDKVMLSTADIVGLSDLFALVEKASAGLADVADVYEKAGDVLASNVERLHLDRDTLHICEFARRVAGELMTRAAQSLAFPGGCWRSTPRTNFPPFYRAIEPGDGLFLTDVKTPEKQRAAMLNTLAHILRKDPSRRVLAESMLMHARERSLWTPADEIDVDE